MRTMVSVLAAVALTASAAAAFAGEGKVVATFGNKMDVAKKDFTVVLKYEGDAAAVSGFAFRIGYDAAQVSFEGVNNNTGAADAGVQYTVGDDAKESLGGGTTNARIIMMTTAKDITKPGNLIELKFAKKDGYKGPFNLVVQDRKVNPGENGADGVFAGDAGNYKNLPHAFDVSAVAGEPEAKK